MNLKADGMVDKFIPILIFVSESFNINGYLVILFSTDALLNH